MSEPLDDLVHRLLPGLLSACAGASAEDLSDAFWLARVRKVGASEKATTTDSSAGVKPTSQEQGSRTNPATTPPPSTETLMGPGQAAGVYLPAVGPGDTAPGQPIVISGVDPLPGTADLIRALRPLMRRGPSRTRVEFDEDETVRRVAEERLWDPALKPMLDRWVRVSIVVDASRSMALWRTPAWAWVRRLQGLSAFDLVRAWWWRTDQEPLQLNQARRGGRLGPPAAPTAVVRSGARGNLVLVVSDCASGGWRSGEVQSWLTRWSRQAHVALVQPLPESVWPTTALGQAAPVWLDVRTPLPPNEETRFERSDAYLYFGPDRGRKGLGPPIPVVSLDGGAAPLARWARAAAGDGVAPIPGVAWKRRTELEPIDPTAVFTAATPTLRPMQALERFLKQATPEAIRLGRLLAAAPMITLPILRLIRARLVPGGRASHEAEVLKAGWLVPESTETAATWLDPDLVRYGMMPEVRQKLLGALPTGAALAVLRELSVQIADRFPSTFDFPAMLDDPAGSPGALVRSEDPIALVAADVLRHIGGAFAGLVRPYNDVGPAPPRRRPPLRPEHEAPWYFERLGIPQLWDMGLTGEGVKIGQFFAIDRNHRLLPRAAGQIVVPPRSLSDENDTSRTRSSSSSPEDLEEMRDDTRDAAREAGTNTATLLIGQPFGALATGIAPRAQLYGCQIETGVSRTSLILRGMDWLMSQDGVRLLNFDLSHEEKSEVLCEAVSRMQERGGIFVVCAAGNYGRDKVGSPVAGQKVFSVGSINQDDRVSEFSSSLTERSIQDSIPTVVAPGEDIMLLAVRRPRESDERHWSGTTPATAMITGLSALLLEAVPEATPQQLRSALIGSCDLPDTMERERAGFGVPNGPIALELLKEEVARSRRASQDRHAAPGPASTTPPGPVGFGPEPASRTQPPLPPVAKARSTRARRKADTESVRPRSAPSDKSPKPRVPSSESPNRVGPSKAARPARQSRKPDRSSLLAMELSLYQVALLVRVGQAGKAGYPPVSSGDSKRTMDYLVDLGFVRARLSRRQPSATTYHITPDGRAWLRAHQERGAR